MQRQNRVDPFGELFATECRGSWMGNRGCLHDASQGIRRPFAVRRWIYCLLEFRGRYRAVMTPGRYTELFFLDEVTALAAGHRPCAECQHQRYLQFRRTWSEANPDLAAGPVPSARGFPSADDIDRVLHAERVNEARGKRTWRSSLSGLPAGTMIADEQGVPYLVLDRRLLRWGPCGYVSGLPRPAEGTVTVLTPRSIVAALRGGFPVSIHPSSLQE